MNKEVITRLKELNIEDFIWLIYLAIIFFSYYSNHLERLYFLSNKKEYKEKYRKIMIIIFSVLLVVNFKKMARINIILFMIITTIISIFLKRFI